MNSYRFIASTPKKRRGVGKLDLNASHLQETFVPGHAETDNLGEHNSYC